MFGSWPGPMYDSMSSHVFPRGMSIASWPCSAGSRRKWIPSGTTASARDARLQGQAAWRSQPVGPARARCPPSWRVPSHADHRSTNWRCMRRREHRDICDRSHGIQQRCSRSSSRDPHARGLSAAGLRRTISRSSSADSPAASTRTACRREGDGHIPRREMPWNSGPQVHRLAQCGLPRPRASWLTTRRSRD